MPPSSWFGLHAAWSGQGLIVALIWGTQEENYELWKRFFLKLTTRTTRTTELRESRSQKSKSTKANDDTVRDDDTSAEDAHPFQLPSPSILPTQDVTFPPTLDIGVSSSSSGVHGTLIELGDTSPSHRTRSIQDQSISAYKISLRLFAFPGYIINDQFV